MQHFAAKYCRDNPGRFSDEDCVYVLAYSVMMLQTSLHKPSIKEKDRMTKAQFISNNRGIDGGKDLPQEYLEALYDIAAWHILHPAGPVGFYLQFGSFESKSQDVCQDFLIESP
ncbi:BIG1 [Symbiodinium pilosum]|uniref:BIG1 protein n=1 Tax=Symbiodinium pilosum TaxID=2952 RepID=A0A812VT46_SYMPI|nr:BIG1 [Symbiodinium pilosum]